MKVHFSAVVRVLSGVVLAAVCSLTLSGCAGITRGAVEALVGDPSKREDKRVCYIKGRSFHGLDDMLAKRGSVSAKGYKPVLKLLMVHGIGAHQPGYSTRLMENIAQALNLSRFDEKVKEIQLLTPASTANNTAILRVTRYQSTDATKEMNFAELTWDPIVEKEKENIYFDNSGEYSFRRTGINNSLKEFVNTTLPDVLMYNGTSKPLIQQAVGTSLCWLMNHAYQDLPESGLHVCDSANGKKAGTTGVDYINDDYVFITHSLGSKITVDAIQWIASNVKDRADRDPEFAEKSKILKEKEFTVFMLSNQLPLLQLGQVEPKVTGQITEICSNDAPRSQERLFKNIKLVAFSDPNDLFSYALPQKFVDKYLDSRLCPSLTNVIINIADITNLFGGEIANPMAAHTEYDNDKRVIGLLAKGIGGADTAPIVTDRCTWLEAIPDDRAKE